MPFLCPSYALKSRDQSGQYITIFPEKGDTAAMQPLCSFYITKLFSPIQRIKQPGFIYLLIRFRSNDPFSINTELFLK